MEKKSEQILQEIGKVIVGKDEIVKKVFIAILSNGHILLEDVPGTGKTTLALALRKVLGMEYKRVQFTPDVVPSDIVGFSIYNKESGQFEYKPGAVMTNLLLADEINRTSSKTQSALLEVMEERQTTVDGMTYKLPEPFIVVATQNPVGSAGTQLLPHAQLDRFMVRLEMGFPDFDSQVELLRDRQRENPLDNAKEIVNASEIVSMQQEAHSVHIDDEILKFITNLAIASHKHPLVTLGISPRGSLAVCRMAKSYAYVDGRDYVKPEDISEIFTDVCNHRIILSPKARITEKDEAKILGEIMGEVEFPDQI